MLLHELKAGELFLDLQYMPGDTVQGVTWMTLCYQTGRQLLPTSGNQRTRVIFAGITAIKNHLWIINKIIYGCYSEFRHCFDTRRHRRPPIGLRAKISFQSTIGSVSTSASSNWSSTVAPCVKNHHQIIIIIIIIAGYIFYKMYRYYIEFF